ncbi:hypothetical protein HAX54_017658, partial [Datura stramonium]|nr:hypothetical protein [Datura stramonium]
MKGSKLEATHWRTVLPAARGASSMGTLPGTRRHQLGALPCMVRQQDWHKVRRKAPFFWHYSRRDAAFTLCDGRGNVARVYSYDVSGFAGAYEREIWWVGGVRWCGKERDEKGHVVVVSLVGA